MKSLKTIFSLALMTTCLFAFAESKEGGGGAGICKDGKCITLAQAGFRIIEQENPQYFISLNTIKDLDRIQNVLSDLITTQSVIGDGDSIVFISVVDTNATKKFIQEYRELLSIHGQTQMGQDLQLLGFTSGQRTYLIKEKYDSLGTRGQALLLVHEYLLRSTSATLADVVKFDGELIDFLASISTGRKINKIPLLKSLKKMIDWKRLEIESYILREVIENSSLNNQEITQLGFKVRKNIGIDLDYRDILEMNELIPNFAKHVSEGFRLINVNESRHSLLYYFYQSIVSKMETQKLKSYKVSQADLNAFLSSKDPSMVFAMNTCGDGQDKKIRPYRQSLLQLSSLKAVDCNAHFDDILGRSYGIQGRIQGMSIVGELLCTWKKNDGRLDFKYVVCN